MFAAVENLQKGLHQNGEKPASNAQVKPASNAQVHGKSLPKQQADRPIAATTRAKEIARDNGKFERSGDTFTTSADYQFLERLDQWSTEHREMQALVTKVAEDQALLKVLLMGMDEKLEQQIQHHKRYPSQVYDHHEQLKLHLTTHLKDIHESHNTIVRSTIEDIMDAKNEELRNFFAHHHVAPSNSQDHGPSNSGISRTGTPVSHAGSAGMSRGHLEHKSSKVKDNWYATGLQRGLKKYSQRDQYTRHLCCGCIHRDSEPSSALAKLMRSVPFDIATTMLIVANTFLVGYETDVRIKCVLKRPPEQPPDWFEWADKVFTYIFLGELIFRMVALRSWFFCGDEWRWNLIDGFIVIASVVQHMLETMQNVSFLRLLRIVRMVRVVRIIRVVRFFRELRKMVFSILSCLISLGWAFLLLLLIMFMFSMFFLQGIISHVDGEYKEKGYIDDEFRDKCLKWFGDTEQTMFSMILSVSGGTDWLEVVTPLDMISEVYRFAFMFYIVFVVFGVLNVLTGVFLESAGEFMDRDLQIQAEMGRMDKFVTEMYMFFKEFDEHHTGVVDFETFNRCMQDEKVQAYLASHQLDCTDAEQLYKLLDANKQDAINLSDFIIGLAWLKGSAKSIDVIMLMMEMLGISEQLRSLQDGGYPNGRSFAVQGYPQAREEPLPPAESSV